ncbi:hypothetical protein [uncultured Legionella sp.]|uniref:hypothetical protein n=1 Tax=uncultured Legionella sp. TaxID=210934 RepID=UPI002610AABA|nr:hypothetical protein [uncultured Legionella sp.]
MRKLIVLLLSIVVGQVNAFPLCPGIHTWHNVTSTDGQWSLTLQPINQQGVFTDSSCNTLRTATLSSDAAFIYGFGFPADADFDIAYTLTAVKKETSFESKACVFVITARGPAQPDIAALSYHGAVCEWTRIPGVGEDFIVG